MLARDWRISGEKLLSTAASLKVTDRVPYKIGFESNNLEVNSAEFREEWRHTGRAARRLTVS